MLSLIVLCFTIWFLKSFSLLHLLFKYLSFHSPFGWVSLWVSISVILVSVWDLVLIYCLSSDLFSSFGFGLQRRTSRVEGLISALGLCAGSLHIL